MTNFDLLDLLGQVDERYLEENIPQKRTVRWKKWWAVAACLILVVGVAVIWHPNLQVQSPSGTDNSIPSTPVQEPVDVGDLQTALVRELAARNLQVATAESCTGGYVAKRITEVPGSSQVFHCGIVSYANEVKEQLLGVRPETLAAHGAVSPETAREMAEGVRRVSGAQIGISLTGVAGPDGGTPEKPVGLVYLGVSSPWQSQVKELHLSRGYRTNNRESIRYLAASHALAKALQVAQAQP